MAFIDDIFYHAIFWHHHNRSDHINMNTGSSLVLIQPAQIGSGVDPGGWRGYTLSPKDEQIWLIFVIFSLFLAFLAIIPHPNVDSWSTLLLEIGFIHLQWKNIGAFLFLVLINHVIINFYSIDLFWWRSYHAIFWHQDNSITEHISTVIAPPYHNNTMCKLNTPERSGCLFSFLKPSFMT